MDKVTFSTLLFRYLSVKGVKFTDEDIKALSHRIQFGGDEVVQAKDGAGSATLSMVRNYHRSDVCNVGYYANCFFICFNDRPTPVPVSLRVFSAP